MRLFSSMPNLRLLSLLTLGLLSTQTGFAQTVQTGDYIYIGIEAEDNVIKNERWVLTTPETPAQENDPDGNHSDQASGSAYLELLPDMRVTHDDTFGPPAAYWGQGGQGPDADYLVDFPEPGRYYVHVRAYSTGTEDNGLHLGIDDTWPQTGQRLQFCSAHRRAWWWSSAQRDSGGNGSCGIEKSIWLDVPTAGQHTVSISAREDGFEIDRLVLLKDLSGNTRVCEPRNISDVNCRDGSIESADEFVDLTVRLFGVAVGAAPEAEPPNPVEVVQGENLTLTAIIENLDGFDTATDIVLTLSPVVGEWNMIAMDDRCAADAEVFTCTLNELHPTAPDENAPFVFTLQAIKEGDLRIDAAVTGTQMDKSPNNDLAATIVKVLSGTPPVDKNGDVKLMLSTDKAVYETNGTVKLTLAVQNVGDVAAQDVSLSVTLPSGINLSGKSLPNACSTSVGIQCSFASVAKAAKENITLELVSAAAGMYTLSGIVNANNDKNAANNVASDSIRVKNPMQTSTSGNTDTAATTGSTTGGSTDTSDAMISTPQTTTDDGGTGAMTHWFLLLLAALGLTRLYGRHQRHSIAI